MLFENFQERAAIMEFDGGLSRQEAQRLALGNDVLFTIIESNQLEFIKEKTSHWWATTKEGRYGKGCIDSPQYIGAVCEVGFGPIIKQEADLSFHHNGKTDDFVVNELLIDIKGGLNPEFNLVMCVNRDGISIEPKCDIYVASYCQFINSHAIVTFRGWVSKTQLMQGEIYPSPYDTHKNYKIGKEISNMASLLNKLAV